MVWSGFLKLRSLPSGEHTKSNGKIHPFFMGKLTISTGPFSIAMLVHQRVLNLAATVWYDFQSWPWLCAWRNRSLSPSTTRRSSNRCLATRRPQNAGNICGYGSIPINTIFSGMNIHKSQLFWCELQGYHRFWHTAMCSSRPTNNSIFSANHPVAFQNFEPCSCTVDCLWWPE